MGYININWVTEEDEEETIIKWIIEAIGDYSLSNRDIRVNREGIIRVRDRVNKFIEKYIKTDYRVSTPVLDKDEDDDDWCKMKLSRKIDFELYK